MGVYSSAQDLRCPLQEFQVREQVVLKANAQKGRSRVKSSVAALGTDKHRSKAS